MKQLYSSHVEAADENIDVAVRVILAYKLKAESLITMMPSETLIISRCQVMTSHLQLISGYTVR